MTTVCVVKLCLTTKPQHPSSSRTILLCLCYRAMKTQTLMTTEQECHMLHGIPQVGQNVKREDDQRQVPPKIPWKDKCLVWLGICQVWRGTRTNAQLPTSNIVLHSTEHRWKCNKVWPRVPKLWPTNWSRVHPLHAVVFQQGLKLCTSNSTCHFVLCLGQ